MRVNPCKKYEYLEKIIFLYLYVFKAVILHFKTVLEKQSQANELIYTLETLLLMLQ